MSPKTLKMADDLALPLEAVTEKIAFLGRTGTGKTYAAMKLAELMLEAGAQIVALDFVGKWFGLRVPGPGAPFPIPVFGGLQGDYPLEPTGGALVADLLVDRGISAVVDVSQFTRADQIRFCLAFATQFFQRKKAAPSAVHLFLEECQEVLPQNAQPSEGAMLGAFERIWKLGRNFGIGGSLISQRPQEINKKALNMSGTLFVFQMTGPQERKTIESWVSAQGINEHIVDVLPTLKKGQPHVWSVALGDLSKTIRVNPKRTADVSATPTATGPRKEQPLTPIDGDALRTAMAATIERAKADDPRELRKRIAELERETKTAKTAPPATSTKDVEVLTAADRELLKALREEFSTFSQDIGHRADALLGRLAERAKVEFDEAALKWGVELEKRRALFMNRLEQARIQRVLEKIDRVAPAPAPVSRISQNRPEIARAEKKPNKIARSAPEQNLASASGLTPGQQTILDTLALLETRGIPSSLDTLCAWLDLHPNGGRFRRNLRELQEQGYLDAYDLTDRGRAAGRRLPTGIDAAKSRLTPGQLTALEAIEFHGQPVAIDGLAELMGLHPNGGRFRGNVTRLREMGLITSGQMKLTEAAYR